MYSNRFVASRRKRVNDANTIASLTNHVCMMYGIIVFENLRFCPSTRKRQSGGFLKNLHYEDRAFVMTENSVYMWTQ